MPAAPTPFHLLRTHHAPLSSVSFNTGNTLLYAGDQDGCISITDLRSRRTVAYWKAHQGGVLTVQEWDGRLISHGRDNSILVHEPQRIISAGPSLASGSQGGQIPAVAETLPVNALNFCKFSIAPLSTAESSRKGKGKANEALLAVPNLTDSELADIYHLPSLRRVFGAVNYDPAPLKDGETRTGLIMSLHLHRFPVDSPHKGAIALALGFEDGRMEVWKCKDTDLDRPWDAKISPDRRWSRVFRHKEHNESIMAMAVDSAFSRAFTVSADHLLVRYDLAAALSPTTPDAKLVAAYSTGHIGNASIAVSATGQVVAVGGWDGHIRLYSAATCKPLGVLESHRETVHCLAFASRAACARSEQIDDESAAPSQTLEIGGDEDSDASDDEEALDGVPPRERWLVSGGKDKRVALWGLMDFDKRWAGRVGGI